MKKMIGILTAIMMAVILICAFAAADEVPQPEGGKKFENDWALSGGLINIVYEEEGYRVMVDLFAGEEDGGTVWEYACYYNEEKDVLQSFSSLKRGYTLDAAGDRLLGEAQYEGIDGEGETTEFAVGEDGFLRWTDGHGEHAGDDLQFRSIGRYTGAWRNDSDEVWVKIDWEGMDEETFCYHVLIHRGGEETFTEFDMRGLPDLETGRLEASGTATVFTLNADGGYDAAGEDDEIYDAFFSELGNGRILFETDNGIELEYDFIGDLPGYSEG